MNPLENSSIAEIPNDAAEEGLGGSTLIPNVSEMLLAEPPRSSPFYVFAINNLYLAIKHDLHNLFTCIIARRFYYIFLNIEFPKRVLPSTKTLIEKVLIQILYLLISFLRHKAFILSIFAVHGGVDKWCYEVYN